MTTKNRGRDQMTLNLHSVVPSCKAFSGKAASLMIVLVQSN